MTCCWRTAPRPKAIATTATGGFPERQQRLGPAPQQPCAPVLTGGPAGGRRLAPAARPHRAAAQPANDRGSRSASARRRHARGWPPPPQWRSGVSLAAGSHRGCGLCPAPPCPPNLDTARDPRRLGVALRQIDLARPAAAPDRGIGPRPQRRAFVCPKQTRIPLERRRCTACRDLVRRRARRCELDCSSPARCAIRCRASRSARRWPETPGRPAKSDASQPATRQPPK